MAALNVLEPSTIGALAAVAAVCGFELVARLRKPPVWLFSAWSALPDSERRRVRGSPAAPLRLLAAAALGWLAAAPEPVRDRAVEHRAAAVVVLDASSSMSADDFRPTRLEAAKRALARFIEARSDVDFGLVVFAASPELLAPVTGDRAAVARALELARLPSFAADGTAIGAALSSAANRLRAGSRGARSIVLLTDGVNNRGAVAPLDAAELARALGIAVHVIGIGTGELSRYSVPTPSGAIEVRARIEIDSATLGAMAAHSGGSYHAVRDAAGLVAALEALDLAPERPAPPASGTETQSLRETVAVAAAALLALELAVRRFLVPELPA